MLGERWSEPPRLCQRVAPMLRTRLLLLLPRCLSIVLLGRDPPTTKMLYETESNDDDDDDDREQRRRFQYISRPMYNRCCHGSLATVARYTTHRKRERKREKERGARAEQANEKGRGGFHENSSRSFEASSSVRASHLAESESPGRPCNDAQVHAGQESLLASPAPSGLSLSTFFSTTTTGRTLLGTATTTVGIGVATTVCGVPLHLLFRCRQTSSPLLPPLSARRQLLVSLSLTLSYLTLPYLTLPYLTLPYSTGTLTFLPPSSAL